MEERVDKAYWALRTTYGLVPLLAGLDKFFNLLTDWPRYLSPLALRVLPMSGQTFMYLVGIIEIAAGILVFSRLARVGAYIVGAWLLCIALNLIAGKFFDIAVRDVALAVGAFTLAALHEQRLGLVV